MTPKGDKNAQQMGTKKIVWRARELVADARLKNTEPWRWWKKGRQEELQASLRRLKSAIQLLKNVDQGDDGSILADLEKIAAWERWLPRNRSEIQKTNSVPTAEQLNGFLDQIIARLDRLAPPKKKSIVKRAIAIAAIVGISSAGAVGLLKHKKPTPPVTTPTRVERRAENQIKKGMLYLQFQAYQRKEDCEDAISHKGWHGVVPYETKRGDWRFKALYHEGFPTFQQATDTINELGRRIDLPPEVGIVKVGADGETTWIKTIEERIVDEAEAGRIHDKRYERVVKDVLERYWPRNERTLHYRGKRITVEHLILAIIQVESSGGKQVLSTKGAKGPMQLMDPTFHYFITQSGYRGKENPYDTWQNVCAGTLYLRYLIKKHYPRHDLKIILRMYNGGETGVLKRRLEKSRENLRYPGKVLQAKNDLFR